MPLNTSAPARYTNVDAPYTSGSTWLEKEQRGNRRSKFIVIGSLLALVIIGVGVGVGVSLTKKHSSSGSSGSSSSVVNQTDSSDPSTFVKDDRLKQSFWGIAYTPTNSLYPDCGNSLSDIITDIQLMSQLTTRLRLYGADCNQSALVLEAIKQTKVNMTVWLGNYPDATDPAPYVRQRDAIIDAIQTYGTDHISGITVGNEFILNYLGSNGGTSANDAVGNAGADLLIANITDTRSAVAALGVSIPIGNSDAGSYINNKVLAEVDYGMANIHAWFADIGPAAGAGWVWDFFQETNIAQAKALSNNPTMYVAETGWPSAGNDTATSNNGAADASAANLQVFMDNYVCQANTNGTGYFFFEFKDEEWKDKQYGGVEGHWGLFYSNKTLKDITIPSCS
ncbi:glycoside hydrolase [Epithele typhae]|uniref:glycoside hydrolase n=1 Tax=Epithele typhae TaxID=378194 RepID=UPI0020074DF1|nr:glycoside hydrolase [Epithele typhae]KAH9945047.1 glycoside hydrolase [Epithele typhae]